MCVTFPTSSAPPAGREELTCSGTPSHSNARTPCCEHEEARLKEPQHQRAAGRQQHSPQFVAVDVPPQARRHAARSLWVDDAREVVDDGVGVSSMAMRALACSPLLRIANSGASSGCDSAHATQLPEDLVGMSWGAIFWIRAQLRIRNEGEAGAQVAQAASFPAPRSACGSVALRRDVGVLLNPFRRTDLRQPFISPPPTGSGLVDLLPDLAAAKFCQHRWDRRPHPLGSSLGNR